MKEGCVTTESILSLHRTQHGYIRGQILIEMD